MRDKHGSKAIKKRKKGTFILHMTNQEVSDNIIAQTCQMI